MDTETGPVVEGKNPPNPPARPFQVEGTAFLRAVERGLLGDAPGLGKTRQALEAAEAPLLVGAPAALYGTWQDEVALWRPDLIESKDWWYVAYSSLCKRGADSKGRMTKALTVPKAEYKDHWATLIADEAHYLKGRDTNWTLAFKKLQSDRLYMQTGTAIPNWAQEIFMILHILRPPGLDINSYWRWAERWFRIWEPKWGGKEITGLKGCTKACKERDPDSPCPHWVRFIVGNQLDRIMKRRTWDDVEDELPPVTPQTIQCEMHPKQAAAYASIERDYLAWVDGVGQVACWSDGDQHSKLVQLTTGIDTLDPSVRASGKLDRLEVIMDSRRYSHTLIGCHFRNTADAIEQRLAKMKIKCGKIRGGIPQDEIDETRRSFQRGEFPVVVATIDKVHLGMTLTRADTAIQVERSFRPDRNEQFFKRIWRMGQDKPCLFITLMTDNPTERATTKLLDGKTSDQVRFYKAHDMARLLRESRA